MSAKFIYHGHHTIVYTKTPDGCSVTCDTCSLPRTIVLAVQFMRGNNVHSLTIDGATLTRI